MQFEKRSIREGFIQHFEKVAKKEYDHDVINIPIVLQIHEGSDVNMEDVTLDGIVNSTCITKPRSKRR